MESIYFHKNVKNKMSCLCSIALDKIEEKYVEQ